VKNCYKDSGKIKTPARPNHEESSLNPDGRLSEEISAQSSQFSPYNFFPVLRGFPYPL